MPRGRRHRGASGIARAVTLAAVLVCAGSPPASAQGREAPARTTDAALREVLRPFGGVSARDQATLDEGGVVTRVLPTIRDEVAVLGVVRVGATPEEFARQASNVATFLAAPTRSAIQPIGSPPSPADLRGVELDDWELRALERCRPTRCGIKLPAVEMELMRHLANSDSPAWPAPVDSAFRAWLLSYVADYEQRGDGAIPAFDDTRAGEEPAAGFRRLVDESAPLLDLVPGLATSLLAPPSELPGSTSIYWAMDRPQGLRQILTVDQLTVVRPPGRDDATLVAIKQLYATHYFDARLDVQLLVGAAGRAGDGYLVELRRAMFDEMPSGGPFGVKGRVVGKLRAALRDDLARRQSPD